MLGFTRQSVLAGSLVMLSPAWTGQGWAQPLAEPASGMRFSSVAVDVSIIQACCGIGPTFELLQRVLRAELRREFPGRLGGPGPRLLVRISGLSLNADVGNGGPGVWGAGGTNTDYLEGEALVVGPHGEVLARHPQLSAVPAILGVWYLPGSGQRGVIALARHLAGWLTRKVS